MQRAPIIILMGFICSALLLYAWYKRMEPSWGSSPPATLHGDSPSDDLGPVAEFFLIERNGNTVTLKDLHGKVWVASFLFTRCCTGCPRISADLLQLQKDLADTEGVVIVSFSVDPEHDTPAVMAEYARHFKQDPSRWTFLTGEKALLTEVGLRSFKLNPVDGSMGHSTRFTLVDRNGRIRGYYISGDDGFMPKLMHDIRQLEQERA